MTPVTHCRRRVILKRGLEDNVQTSLNHTDTSIRLLKGARDPALLLWYRWAGGIPYKVFVSLTLEKKQRANETKAEIGYYLEQTSFLCYTLS